MATALIEGLERSGVDRLVWAGGAGGLRVGRGTQLVETDAFSDDLVPLAQIHVDACEIISEIDDLDWTVVAPPTAIEPGERTDDFAIAFVDERETDDAGHTRRGVGHRRSTESHQCHDPANRIDPGRHRYT